MCKGVGNIAFSLRILKQKGMSVANFLEYFENWMTKYYYTHIDLYYINQQYHYFMILFMDYQEC